MFMSDLIIIWLYVRGTGTETCWMGNVFPPDNLRFDNIPTRIMLNFCMTPKLCLLTRSAALGLLGSLLFFPLSAPGTDRQTQH